MLDTAERARDEAAKPRWLKPVSSDPEELSREEAAALCDDARKSWRGRFQFQEEDPEAGTPGLRSPQSGALHAILAHWKVTTAPATVVMPTGTGKTETMLALLVSQRLHRLLVVVPTVALRDQVSRKFITLGILKDHGIVSRDAHHPVVGVMEHRPRTVEEVDELFARCNVVVTNMQVVGGCEPAIQERIAEACTHLFIDEAHHISARTWDAFRRRMLAKVIVQFTATPFRTDGRHVDGKVVFNYPLRKAQEEGYFRPINFRPVNVFGTRDADREIACAALARLDADRGSGLRHLVMARVDSIDRASSVHALYAEIAPGHRPLLIHSKMPQAQRREALRALRADETRVIVCVDMLGEGFDLPELKIAALHDMHKSLAITLQFTGRFTRTAAHLGRATVVANIADPGVDESLRDLYAEDADWNVLLRRLSEGETGRQQRRSDLIESFVDAPPEIALRNIAPKMSAVVYRTACERWRPEDLDVETKWVSLLADPAISRRFEMAVFVTREVEPVSWGAVKEISNVSYHLYVLHWNRELGLLFINSSNNDGTHEGIAKSVAGEDISLIRGEEVFRSLHGINRLVLMNLGLSHSLSKAVRFTMLVGADIAEAVTSGDLETKTKSNTFGKGYADGGKVTVGCSKKGRVWSYKIAYDPSEWLEWCQAIGRKLIDESIDPGEIILRNVLLPERVSDRPALVPLVIEWSEEFYNRPEEGVTVEIDGEVAPFYEAGLELIAHERDGPIQFRVFTETKSAGYRIAFRGEHVRYEPLSRQEVRIKAGKRIKTLSEWFDEEPPVVRFEDNTFLIYNEQFRLRNPGERAPYPRERLEAWSWPAHVDLTVESQKVAKRPHSIQFHALRVLADPAHDPHYSFLLDDDDHHEAADIVGLKVVGERLVVHFYHCKFSKERMAGARVDDLYAVCGQAQKSVMWKADPVGLLQHLRRRSAERERKHGVSRFEVGNDADLAALAHRARLLIPDFRIFIVQPGLSKANASREQLDLLAATEAYLKETYAIPLTVIGSP
nr:DEAD/DEAH box helicase family protein [Microvirga lupini]